MRSAAALTVAAAAALALASTTAAQALPDGRADEPVRTVDLEEAVALALERNPEVRIAAIGLEGASEQVREARSGLFPELSANVRYGRNVLLPKTFLPAVLFDPDAPPDELIPVALGTDNEWRLGLSVTQPLFDARAFIGVGAAERFRGREREAVRAVAQRSVTGTREAYYGALLAAEEVRVVVGSVERLEETLEEAKAMERAGVASEYDVLRLEVRLANLRPEIRRAENALAEAERELGLLVGEDGRTRVRPAGRLADLRPEDGPRPESRAAGSGARGVRALEEGGASDLSHRADIREAAVMVELESSVLAAERAEFLPRLSAFADYSLAAQDEGSPNFFGESSRNRAGTAQVGLMVELPLFTGFRRTARVQQQSATLRQAEMRLEALRRQAASEVRAASDQVAEAWLRLEGTEKAVEQAKRGFEIARREYAVGTGSQLEVTDAEDALRESERNHARAMHDVLASRARLDLALGRVPAVDGEDP